jgi:hypothetical protein
MEYRAGVEELPLRAARTLFLSVSGSLFLSMVVIGTDASAEDSQKRTGATGKGSSKQIKRETSRLRESFGRQAGM